MAARPTVSSRVNQGRQVRHSGAGRGSQGLARPRRHGPRQGRHLPPDLSLGRGGLWELAQRLRESGMRRSTRSSPSITAPSDNILRCLAAAGCDVTVVPATATTEDVLRHKPDGVFLSNGPGDPAATGTYAVPVIQELIAKDLPIFGICLGHQMLALALGGKTRKMASRPSRRQSSGEGPRHRQGRDHQPESRLRSDGGKPAEERQRHPPAHCSTAPTKASTMTGKPIFSVQYHPEASPGPQDSHYLFHRFVEKIEAQAVARGANRPRCPLHLRARKEAPRTREFISPAPEPSEASRRQRGHARALNSTIAKRLHTPEFSGACRRRHAASIWYDRTRCLTCVNAAFFFFSLPPLDIPPLFLIPPQGGSLSPPIFFFIFFYRRSDPGWTVYGPTRNPDRTWTESTNVDRTQSRIAL